ncbi:MAG TPA: FG-GAP and VCBS repeat-containing protein [Opitutaceae bacterium]|nr:FG-GAP and VCBS repeat-containing protein [Opitutaceae bacterium]
MTSRCLPGCLFLVGAAAAAAADLPALRMRPQTIDAKIQIGYGLAIADVDGDGKDDILLADAKQIVWYRNPSWEKFVMAESLTAKDNVCIAARDLDGDGKAEVAVGAEWNPSDTVNSGAVFLLEAPADRTQRWSAKKLPHEPTTHRMHWMPGNGGKFSLAVLPLHGRGNKAATGEGEGVKFHAYAWPWREGATTTVFDTDAGLHLTHNFEMVRRADGPLMMVATKEGVQFLEPRDKTWHRHLVTTRPAGEVRSGSAPKLFVAAIEPMHGNELVVYREPAPSAGDWSATRMVLDSSLVQGHGLAVGDLLGIGRDQIVAGWRGPGGAAQASAKVGIKVFAAEDAAGEKWKQHALLDDNQMACEDLKVADLNGDGRPEVVAAGRATKNVIIYWNETGSARGKSSLQ